MRLRVPKTERKAPPDSRGKKAFKKVLLWFIGIVLLLLVAIRILDLTGMINFPLLKAPEKAVANVMTPVQNGFSSVVGSVVDYLRKIKLRNTIELEYNRIKQENEQLVYQAMLADELQKKLNVYEDLFKEISVNESMNPITCTVIDRDSGNYFSVFTINRGSNDGISDYMAVTMGGALVGYTYDVTASKAKVRAIIDSEASIAGLIQSTRDQGTVRGTLGIDGKAMCRMYYLPDDHLPRPGDMVVTSGVGMSFPKGIPIGTVRESTRGMESNKSYIVVQPDADFEHVEYVIVLRYQPEAGAVESRIDTGSDIEFVPLDSKMPVPTIQIGSDFFQLAPTLAPSPTPAITDESGLPAAETPAPAPTSAASNGMEYTVPEGKATDNSYGYTLPPTATPTPTLPPPEYTVEDD